ncbi:zinc-dependent alcohol dehydrogenase family protein [Chloroflexus sp. MS-CIW-1]|jgi:propanol-preferring alcohol dehydrogenase|uniref:zinc-dependent alcohol dehydrogenase family protein n=1 Tax=unclassified Chloroflexus TaxID=2633855 RepID=UPI0004DF8E4A|nr:MULTISPECIES: zinc-dependent alcohol dehydrogenase family protein [unclassified Chloroflexus]MDN5271836.1 zinc-dependent alcohol dehydrogenase family protein [Chloroflexus sp. MS-CIW-1]
MQAIVLTEPGQPLELRDLPVPTPGPDEVLIRVEACAVCRTDLHIVDGELPAPRLPLIPGHQIVGTVEQLGERVTRWTIGQRVGVPWLGWTCGSCRFCREGRENLCDQAQFTGYTRPGGFAEYTVADQRFCFALPANEQATAVAPLLCAGLIGYRALRLAGEGERLGIYGFGAAAHLITQVARWQGRQVFAFTRPGDRKGQQFAREVGAVWAGNSTDLPPTPLDAAIIFAPVGDLVPQALRAVAKGGVVVCGGIHMSPIPAFPYELLWGERVVRSVANLTREDGEAFLQIAPQVPVQTTVEVFPLAELNAALYALRQGTIHGAAVIQIAGSKA